MNTDALRAVLLSIPLALAITVAASFQQLTLPQDLTTPFQQHNPADRHLDLKLRLLELTNIRRTQEGLLPLVLGTNPASQLHADAALERCYNSHWDAWGLKPNHRHALAGGTGHTLENIIGLNLCVSPNDGYAPLAPMLEEVETALTAWMNSPGHRAAIVNPSVTTLHLGLAHDSHNLRIVQHLESDYVSHDTPPTIDASGTLRMSGSLQRAHIDQANDLPSLRIGYEPPPTTLTRGQLARTHAGCPPTIIATVHQPKPHTASLKHIPQRFANPPCIDPVDTSPALAAPATPEQSNILWLHNKLRTQTTGPTTSNAARIPAETFTTDGRRFHIQADLSDLLERHGPGIYSLILLATPDHMDHHTPVTAHPIFWRTEVPHQNPYAPPTPPQENTQP